VQTQGITLEI